MATTLFFANKKGAVSTRPELAKKLLVTSSSISVDVLMAYHSGDCMNFAALDLVRFVSSAT